MSHFRVRIGLHVASDVIATINNLSVYESINSNFVLFQYVVFGV